MFIDRLRIWAMAGNGGPGCVSFRRESHMPKGGPDGGDGGKGGDVILRVNPNLNHLLHLKYQPHQKAGHGQPGQGAQKSGKKGKDIVVEVPPGTAIYQMPTDEETFHRAADDSQALLVKDIVADGEVCILCQGGKGGKGNTHYKSSVNQTPRKFGPGKPGERGQYIFELKSIAQAGLVGFPNAGKSSLLRSLSSAKPKVASYPFTTLSPVVGIIEYDDFSRVTMADIPGIIEGAHEGLGLGLEFLKHIERCKVLVHLIDMAGSDGRDPVEDYRAIRKELKCYDPELAKRPSILAANKMDLPAASANLETFRSQVRKKIIPLSAQHKEGLDDLKKAIRKELAKCAHGEKDGGS